MQLDEAVHCRSDMGCCLPTIRIIYEEDFAAWGSDIPEHKLPPGTLFGRQTRYVRAFCQEVNRRVGASMGQKTVQEIAEAYLAERGKYELRIFMA